MRTAGCHERQADIPADPWRCETGFTRAEKDVADVMIRLRCNHGREPSYADIAAGV